MVGAPPKRPSPPWFQGFATDTALGVTPTPTPNAHLTTRLQQSRNRHPPQQ